MNYKITARITLDFNCEIKASEEVLFHFIGEDSPCIENIRFALERGEYFLDTSENCLEIDSGFDKLRLHVEEIYHSLPDFRIEPVEC